MFAVAGGDNAIRIYQVENLDSEINYDTEDEKKRDGK